jgi:hypothetical protein
MSKNGIKISLDCPFKSDSVLQRQLAGSRNIERSLKKRLHAIAFESHQNPILGKVSEQRQETRYTYLPSLMKTICHFPISDLLILLGLDKPFN